MQTSVKILGGIALALTIVPPLLFLAGSMALATMQTVMLVGCVLWFATAPFFMKAGE